MAFFGLDWVLFAAFWLSERAIKQSIFGRSKREGALIRSLFHTHLLSHFS